MTLLQGNGFTPPADGVKLISKRWGEDRKYSFQGEDKKATLLEPYFDKDKFFDLLVYTTVEGRTKPNDRRKKTDNSTKGILFSDYILEQPLLPPKGRGRGSRWAFMGPTNQGVTMFRFVWRKKGTEAQRLAELNELLAENDVVLH